MVTDPVSAPSIRLAGRAHRRSQHRTTKSSRWSAVAVRNTIERTTALSRNPGGHPTTPLKDEGRRDCSLSPPAGFRTTLLRANKLAGGLALGAPGLDLRGGPSDNAIRIVVPRSSSPKRGWETHTRRSASGFGHTRKRSPRSSPPSKIPVPRTRPTASNEGFRRFGHPRCHARRNPSRDVPQPPLRPLDRPAADLTTARPT